MKKIVAILIVLLISLSLVSCKSNPTNNPDHPEDLPPRDDVVDIDEALEVHSKLEKLFSSSWVWDISKVYEPSHEFGVLNFSRDGSLLYEIGNPDGSIYTCYKGKFELSIEENKLEKPAIIYLDLYLDSTLSKEEIPEEIHARYYADISGNLLELWNASGEPLYMNEEENFIITYYEFWLKDSPINKKQK